MIRNGDLQRDPRDVRYGQRPPVAAKLDPFKPIIRARVAEFAQLTTNRLLHDIRAAGYPGRITQLRDYLSAIRPQAGFGWRTPFACCARPTKTREIRRIPAESRTQLAA
jgi:transposase